MIGREKEWWKRTAIISTVIAFVLLVGAVIALILFNHQTLERREETRRRLCAVPGENVEYCRERF